MIVTFKEAIANDIPAILEMMASFNAIDNYPFDKEITAKNLLHFLSTPEIGRLWVIQIDELPVGYVVLAFGYSFEYQGRDAFVDELFLKDEFRDKGIGAKAMSFIDQQAVLLNLHAVHLEVEKHNAKGTRIYLRQGYSDNGRILLTKRF